MHDLHKPVTALLAGVGELVVMPRFRNLRADEIVEKSRGELVTVADHESELRLHDGLATIDPAARIIGEEACAADPSLMNDLGRGRIWIIDPIDGTSNFAEGRQPFGMIIALIEDGRTIAGWLYDPVAQRICHAVAGGGAFIGDEPAVTRTVERQRPVATLATQFMAATARERTHARAEQAFDLVPIPRCAAEHYPRLATGEYDVALFQRILPWDHAAGALFLTEAGGRVSRWDGSDYRIDDHGTGLVAAASDASWRLAMDVLKPGEPGFLAGE
ncbi:inositol monophosphatase family protein [Sphingomonas sp. Leaf343]|uniref:inositol monophosphatase family protein n=1 Tax=Sphingomonas sp. Leaf343 TaxID=1736345 RepID=UPI0006FCABD3|nr:inositol monophosphatase family protein [Sphingomonas sp. Leaf343]KQR86238.1 inositol monophosphatase [Sphingomonas sp. Leaf343]